MLPDANNIKSDEQIIQYLMNFWEHSLNDTLSNQSKIRKISKSNPAQIQFYNDSNWYFIQDFRWEPTLKEATDRICGVLDIHVNYETSALLKNKVFRAIPNTFQELYDSIVEFRVESF